MQAILSNDCAVNSLAYKEKTDYSAEKQLSLYTNGYKKRLYKILAHIYPATLYYMGQENFRALVEAFITSTPSRTFNIDAYAITFGEYIAHNSEDTFAIELALLESIGHEAYYQPETPALQINWLKQQTPETLINTPLKLRAASYLLIFSYPVSSYITALRALENPIKPLEKKTYLMLLRDNGRINHIELEEAEYILLNLIAEGYTIGSALVNEQFISFGNNKNINNLFQGWFSRWVNEGFFIMPY